MISSITFLISVASQSLIAASNVCPDLTVGESAQDCPFAGIARTLSQDAQGGKILLQELPALAPNIASQLKVDAARPGIRSIWGKSINFDENAHAIVVDPAILDTILALSHGPKRQDRFVHAGLEHTYGYLFSVLKTPFGYKRARWVENEIETGLGLPSGLLGPNPSEGTLLGNVSFVAGMIGLRDDAHALGILRADPNVPRSIKSFDYQGLKIRRLEEVLDAPLDLVIRTDFVDFKAKSAQGDSALLVYSVKYLGSRASNEKTTELITTFPVAQNFVDQALAPTHLGPGVLIQSKYNADIEGVSGVDGLKGTRRIAP